MKTVPIWKALYGNKVPSNMMVHGASKSFIWNILHSIHFCPIKSLQSKDLERALPILLPYLEAADDVTLTWASSALFPSREIVEGPCNSTVRWHQQQVPITQPILEATLTKDYQIAVQGWSKKPKGCRGTMSTLTFPSGADRHWSTASAELLQQGNQAAARSKSCCFTWS